MNTTDQPTGRKIYLIFLLIAIIITAASALAQSAKTNTAFAFPELSSVSSQPNNYELIQLPENFDYPNLKIEIYGSERKVEHCYVCYSVSESSFIIDLTNFANGTYSVNVMNGKSTFFKTMTVSK